MKSGNGALAFKVLVAVAALAIAGTLAADVFVGFLDRPARSTLAGAGALVAFVSASAAAVGQWRSQRAESHREAAGVRLRALGWSIYDLTGIDVRDLGLALYVVRPSPVRRWRPLLRRVAYERSRRAVTTGVQWRPGMGVIGQCVASGERSGQDVGMDEEPYLDLTVGNRSDYETQVPEHVRSGLSRQEWLAARGKYEAVVAFPLIDQGGGRGTVRGCISVDGPRGTFAQLWSDDVANALEEAARDLTTSRW